MLHSMFGFLGFVAILGSGLSFTTRRAWSRAQLSMLTRPDFGMRVLIIVLETEFEV